MLHLHNSLLKNYPDIDFVEQLQGPSDTLEVNTAVLKLWLNHAEFLAARRIQGDTFRQTVYLPRQAGSVHYVKRR